MTELCSDAAAVQRNAATLVASVDPNLPSHSQRHSAHKPPRRCVLISEQNKGQQPFSLQPLAPCFTALLQYASLIVLRDYLSSSLLAISQCRVLYSFNA